jgi:hypothetical protein
MGSPFCIRPAKSNISSPTCADIGQATETGPFLEVGTPGAHIGFSFVRPKAASVGFSCAEMERSMLEIAISLIVGFALGYGVREWAFRQNRSQQRRRRPF